MMRLAFVSFVGFCVIYGGMACLSPLPPLHGVPCKCSDPCGEEMVCADGYCRSRAAALREPKCGLATAKNSKGKLCGDYVYDCNGALNPSKEEKGPDSGGFVDASIDFTPPRPDSSLEIDNQNESMDGSVDTPDRRELPPEIIPDGEMPPELLPEVSDSADSKDQADQSCACGTPGVSFLTCGKNVGECKMGKALCLPNCQWGKCVGEKGPSQEQCNGKDDNCDGKVDENLTQTCSTPCGGGYTYCKNSARTSCDAPKPSPEVCDNKDNDCNGKIDDVPSSFNTSCTPSGVLGECKKGTRKCVRGATICDAPNPVPEVCNNKDDDCDGSVDEGLSRVCSNGCGTQACRNGVYTSCSTTDVDGDTHSDYCDYCPSFKDQTNSPTRCRSTPVKGFYFAALGSSGWCAYRSGTGSISWIILRNGMVEVTGVHCPQGKKCVIICALSSLSGLKSSYNFYGSSATGLNIIAEQSGINTFPGTPTMQYVQGLYGLNPSAWTFVKFAAGSSTQPLITKIVTSGPRVYQFSLSR